MDSPNTTPLSDAFYWYYNQGREQARLLSVSGQLEFVRTQELIGRYLPKPPVTIYDIGGGAGIYALPLAREGYSVHLVDAMPLHIEQAGEAAKSQPYYPLASATVGDARHLDFPDNSADAVLFFGPLYHLTEAADRLTALREAYRVLKPGGWLFAGIISRFASFLDSMQQGFYADPYFMGLVEQDLIDGQHRNPKQQHGYFSTAYFHHPDELPAEITRAGFHVEAVLPIEGVGWLTRDFDASWNHPDQRERLLRLLRMTENEPSLLGASGHIMGIGKKV